MREYETMIITKSDLPEADLTKLVNRWEALMTNNGGEIIKKDVWGVRRLAYEIDDNTRGNYMVYDVASNQEDIVELQRILKLDENVLRAMVIKLADTVNVEARKIELQKAAEEAAQRANESARDRADSDSSHARRGEFAAQS